MTFVNVYNTVFITAPEGELQNCLEALAYTVGSITFSEKFIDYYKDECRDLREDPYDVDNICTDVQRVMLEGWENRAKSEDIAAQKQFDEKNGYVRIYDAETGLVYRAFADFFERYKGSQYLPAEDEKYILPVRGYVFLETETTTN